MAPIIKYYNYKKEIYAILRMQWNSKNNIKVVNTVTVPEMGARRRLFHISSLHCILQKLSP
jgi:hypothetical protein